MNVMKERRLRGAIPTQLEVAKAVGVKPSAVSKWERGLAKPLLRQNLRIWQRPVCLN